MLISAITLLLLTSAQSTGWVLWVGTGDHKGYFSWLIADAFEEFVECRNILDDQLAIFLPRYPKDRYEVTLNKRNAVRSLEAVEIRTEEEALTERQRLSKGPLTTLDDKTLDEMSKRGRVVRIKIICLLGGTIPQPDKEG
jgi:hypothetical protein